MVTQICRLGEKILERRALDFLHLPVRAVPWVEIVLKERAEIDFLKRIFFFCRSGRIFFVAGGSGALPIFLLTAYFIEQRNGFLELLKNRVFHHLRGDHVLELKLVEREDRDHLHEARSQDLPLRQLDAQFVLQQDHGRLFASLNL